MKDVELYKAANIVIEKCLGIKSEEEFLVVTDNLQPQGIGKALVAVAGSKGAEAMLMSFSPRERTTIEPGRAVLEAMKAVDAALCYTSASMFHTLTRKKAQETGTRIIVMPSQTEDSFLRAVNLDLDELATTINNISERISKAKVIHIKTSAGTDLVMKQGAPSLVYDGICKKKGDFDLLPAGVNVVVPEHGSAKGMAVIDGAITGIGRLNSPVTLTIEKGKAISIKGGAEADALNQLLAGLDDPNTYNCPAEWGVGTNRTARLSEGESTAESERIYGWVHISLGDNAKLPGGKISAGIHLDATMKKTTIELDGETVLKEGEFCLK